MAKAQQSGGGGGSLYYEIANFQSGMDLRKSPLTAPAGTLRLLQNAHITSGGEVEKRAAFVPWCTAPPNSLGLCAVNDQVYTHLPDGSAGVIDAPTTGALGVIHIAQPSSAVDLTASIQPLSIMNVTAISGGSLTVGAGITGGTTVAQTKIIAFKTGTGGVGTYYVSPVQSSTATTADGGITMTATISGSTTLMTVTAITGTLVVGSKIFGTNVAAGTAVSAFDTGTGGVGTYFVTPDQTSYPSGAVGPPVSGVTLQYQLDFDTFNGDIYAVFFGSDGNNYHYFKGVQVVQATNKGYNIRTYKHKIYGVNGRTLSYSALDDPSVWADPSPDNDGNIARNGAGHINIGAEDADSENMVSMEVYYDKLALFSTLACQLWFLDPDPSLNQYYQTLRDAGTIAPASVRQYVANDVYFLGNHGIRSLRARDLTLTAAVADVGSPLDPTIQDLLAIRGQQWGAWQTQALLDPRTGRIWFTFGDKIYVLSNYASPNISAWSVYVPEFFIDIQGAVFADPYVVFRDQSTRRIYRYGSTSAPIYDACPVQFLTPFLSFDKPASYKFYQGFDAICTAFNDPVHGQGQWLIEMSFDPVALDPVTGTSPFDTICQIDNATVQDGRIPISGRGTHLQIRATYSAPGPATFSKLFVHYAPSDTS